MKGAFMTGLSGELKVKEIRNRKRRLVLTTHRVRYEFKSWGYSNRVGIMLDALASCGVTRSSSPLWLVLAAVALAWGVISAQQPRNEMALAVGMAGALVFILIYFLTRREMITLTCAGGTTIRTTTAGVTAEVVNAFLEAVERAKNARYALLTGQSAAQPAYAEEAAGQFVENT
jgi:hypothetical protein